MPRWPNSAGRVDDQASVGWQLALAEKVARSCPRVVVPKNSPGALVEVDQPIEVVLSSPLDHKWEAWRGLPQEVRQDMLKDATRSSANGCWVATEQQHEDERTCVHPPAGRSTLALARSQLGRGLGRARGSWARQPLDPDAVVGVRVGDVLIADCRASRTSAGCSRHCFFVSRNNSAPMQCGAWCTQAA